MLLDVLDVFKDEMPAWKEHGDARRAAGEALRGDPGAADRARRQLPGDRPLDRLSLRRVSVARADGAAESAAGRGDAGADTRCADGRHSPDARGAGTFDRDGWLRIGLCGHQPGVGETYISTGSLYLCAVGFLPLGLPATDDFWAAPAQPWTSVRAWSGQAFPIDHALST